MALGPAMGKPDDGGDRSLTAGERPATLPATPVADRPLAPGWRRWLPDIGVAAFFVLLAVAVTWPLATGVRDRLVSWGDPVFQTWTIAWDWHAWRTDPLGVFDANIFYPYRNTLAYSDHLFGQALLIGPVLLATGNAILANNLSVLIALALSGVAMYLLVLDLTGSRLAGIVAGVAFAVAPPRLAHLEHLHLLSAQWLPLAVLAARRALLRNSWRWAAVLGLVVVLQGLFGVYYLLFMVVLLLIVGAAYLIAHWRWKTVAALGKLVVCCALGAALLLPTLWPYWQVNQELGVERTEAELQQWRAIPSDYLSVNPDNRLYGATLAPRYHRDLERDLFPGAVLLLLGLFGLANRRLGWERWTLAALTAIPVLLSFGLVWHVAGWSIPSLYQPLYELLPGFKAIRVPARFGLLALVGLAGLAGLGADQLLRQVASLAGRVRWPRGAARLPGPRTLAALGLAGALGFGILAESVVVMSLAPPLPTRAAQANRPDYAWMADHPAPSIELPMGEGLIATAWPNFWSLFHWNQVVNGYSGFAPPAYYVVRDRMRAFPSNDTIRLLQGIGVRTVVYHADPAVPPADDPVLRAVERFPALTQVVDGPDYVFQLAPDPWMWELARSVPAGAAVDLPMLEADPATFGMLAAILQRTGHTVYGRGTLEYWQLPAAPASTCYGIVPDGPRVPSARYQGAASIDARGGLVLYRLAGCAGP